jgi:hypothetical protein
LRLSYDERQAGDYLSAWAKEDVYVPLASEIVLMEDAGFRVEVLWRKDAFAVLQGRRS